MYVHTVHTRIISQTHASGRFSFLVLKREICMFVGSKTELNPWLKLHFDPSSLHIKNPTGAIMDSGSSTEDTIE